MRAIAKRHDMAVSGPNGEGFANTAAALCPTFSPVMEAGNVPLLPGGGRGQVAVISQSGGMGFAFFDSGRPKNLSFRYIVTTGNEACLETFDFVDYMLDEGKTDVFLLLVEDVKTPETFERLAAKALRAGKPLIVSKLGQSQAGSRAVASHTAARAGSPATYRAMFERYGAIESNDPKRWSISRWDFWPSALTCPPESEWASARPPAAAAPWWLTRVAAGLEVPELDAATRRKSTCIFRPTAPRRIQST